VRTVLITGAARRVGQTLAGAAARKGWAVALHANTNLAEAEALAAALRADGCVASAVAANLADWSETEGLIGRARDALGTPLTALINNASTFENDSVETFDQASWALHMDVNLRAPCQLAQAFAAQLPSEQQGVVINLLDQRVLKPTPLFFSYSLSKAALFEATRTMAQALAPNIRVNGVGPGPTIRNVRQSEADFAKQGKATLLERGATPDEIADAVLWLLEAKAVTGQMIAVDGGQHLAWRTPDVDGIVE
jgi:NAD(P)-dependent dehydrogenase (short-subunit alcohol dehydrogenase family)